MAYEEEGTSRSQNVTASPSGRREQFETHTVRESSGKSGTPAGAIVGIVVVGIIAIIALFVALSNRNYQAENMPAATLPSTQPPTGQSPGPQNQTAQPRAPQPVPGAQTQAVAREKSSDSGRLAPAPTNEPSPTDQLASIPDDVLLARVEAVLFKSKQLDTADITVTTSNGTVKLTGTVDTDQQKRYAETLVRQVRGVRRLENQILVTGG
ncbi:MAG TPA: BON domain-containing protein [Acidobacteriota bacterium]|jgi:hypothetical protein|nr:BON domain-containing protein [Acidobacteriota bacterium]